MFLKMNAYLCSLGRNKLAMLKIGTEAGKTFRASKAASFQSVESVEHAEAFVEAASEAKKVLPSQVPGPGKVVPSKAEVVSEESVGASPTSNDVKSVRLRASVDKSAFISAKMTVRMIPYLTNYSSNKLHKVI